MDTSLAFRPTYLLHPSIKLPPTAAVAARIGLYWLRMMEKSCRNEKSTSREMPYSADDGEGLSDKLACLIPNFARGEASGKTAPHLLLGLL